MSVTYLLPQLRLERARTLRCARVDLGTPFILGRGSMLTCYVDRSEESGDQVLVEMLRMGRRSAFFLRPGQPVRPFALESGELCFTGIEFDDRGRLQGVFFRVIDDSQDIYATA